MCHSIEYAQCKILIHFNYYRITPHKVLAHHKALPTQQKLDEKTTMPNISTMLRFG